VRYIAVQERVLRELVYLIQAAEIELSIDELYINLLIDILYIELLNKGPLASLGYLIFLS
jgi:hypothetical protein